MTPKEKQNCEGLIYLTWDMFDSPNEEGSGYRFMEREPVLILDEITNATKYILKVELGYTSKTYADKIGLPTNSSHRTGKAVRLRVVGPRKRLSLVSYLVQLGVKRIGINREFVYFDTETLKKPGIYFH
jgi:hypothetical protein